MIDESTERSVVGSGGEDLLQALKCWSEGFVAGAGQFESHNVYPTREQLEETARAYVGRDVDLRGCSWVLVERRVNEAVEHIDNMNYGR